MRSSSSGWAAVIEAITTAAMPTTASHERAGAADIADASSKSDSDPAQLVFAILPSFEPNHDMCHPKKPVEQVSIPIGERNGPGRTRPLIDGRAEGLIRCRSSHPVWHGPAPGGLIGSKSRPSHEHHDRTTQERGGRAENRRGAAGRAGCLMARLRDLGRLAARIDTGADGLRRKGPGNHDQGAGP